MLTNYIQGISHKQVAALFSIGVGALLMLACSSIRIPLPFSPVPFTLQTLAALCLGLYLGSSKGAIASLIGFAGHPALFFSQNGGYVLGFAVMAFIMGHFCHQKARSRVFVFITAVIACMVQLLLGAAWLAFFIGPIHAFWMGLVPFISGELLKALIVSRLRKT